MLNTVKILDSDGNVIENNIVIPEGGRVIIEDECGAFIEVKNSSELDPIGIIVDVYDSAGEFYTSVPLLYDDIDLRV